MAELTENAKDYIECLKDILQRKYLLSGEKALDMITTSYIMESLIDYPEETLHDDIEAHADNIYEDFCPETTASLSEVLPLFFLLLQFRSYYGPNDCTPLDERF